MIFKIGISKEETNNVDELVEKYKNLNIEKAVSKMRTDEVVEAEIKAVLNKQKYLETDIEQATAIKTNNDAKIQSISLTKAQVVWDKIRTAGLYALNAALSIGATLLASMFVTGLIKFLSNLANKEKDLAEAAETANNKISQLNKTLSNQKKTINEYANEYAILAQGVDQLSGKNVSLSTDDYERFLEISNILGDTFPGITKNFDDNGNAILDLTGNVDSIVDSLNNLIEAQQRLNNQEIINGFDDIYENYYNSIEKTNDKINQQIKLQDKLKEAKDILTKYSNGKSITGEQENLKYQDALRMYGIDPSEYSISTSLNEDGTIGFIYSMDKLNTDKEISQKYNELFTQSERNIQTYEDSINAKRASVNQAISALLTNDYDFTDNLSKNLQAGMMKVFTSFDPSNLPEYIDSSNGTEVYNYLRSTYLTPILGLSEEIQKKLVDVFNKPADMSDTEYIELVDRIQKYFDSKNIKINLDFMVEDEKELQDRLSNVISNISANPNDKTVIKDFMKTEGIDNSSEIEFFIKVTNGAKNAEEAIRMYNAALQASKRWEDIDDDKIYESLDSIRSAYNTVSDAIKEYKESKHLSLETIEELLQLDDKYLVTLYDENGQLQLNKDAYDRLTEAKLNELYVSAMYDALNAIQNLGTEEEAVHDLKLATEECTEANWDYVSSVIASAEAELNAEEALGNQTSGRRQKLDDIKAKTLAQINLFKEAAKGIKFNDFYESKSSKSSSSKKEFSKEFDWIKNSVDNVKSSVDKLNDSLNNTTGFKERLSLYDELIKKDQDLIDTTKNAAEAYEKEWIKASNKIGSYKNKIISGETFSVETITDEDLANNIDKAMTAYENWQSMIDQYNKAVIQKDTDKKAKIKVKLELEETKLDIHSIIDEESMSSQQLNKHLEEERQLKLKILKYNLELAETDEEKIKLQKEYNQYLKDNQDLIYDNNKKERDNKINYYASRIQDIQNAIALTENKNGQGTEKQYKAMNSYIDNEIEIEKENIREALKKRNKSTYGTDEWEKYNNEIQTAQDNIYSLKNAQIENNRAILQLPIKKIEEANEALQDQLDIISKIKENVESAISSASNIVQNQIDVLTEQKEATEEYFDSQIDSINKQKDALTKTNEEIKNQLALEKAQYEFEKLTSQKTAKIYREGVGFVYEADQESIRDAKEELDNQEYNSAIHKFEVELEALEKSKEEAIDAIDVQINSLELYKERIDSITQSYQNMLELQQLIALFGQDSVSKIENGDLSIIDDMTGIYNGLAMQEDSLQLQIESNEKAIEQIEKYAEKWNGSSKTIITAKQAIEQVVSDNTKEIESIQQRNNTIKTVGDAWNETRLKLEEELGFIKDNQIVAKDDEASILEERLNNIKSFAKQASEYLSKVTTALSKAEDKQLELNKIANQNNTNSNTDKDKLSIDTMGEKHTGLSSGYVGESKNTKDKFKYIALSDLKPDEIPYLLLKNEAVLNESQQDQILDNMKTSFLSGFNFSNSNLSNIPIKTKSENVSKNIEFNGDIILQNVNDTNTLAKKIKNEFLIKLDQEFYK